MRGIEVWLGLRYLQKQQSMEILQCLSQDNAFCRKHAGLREGSVM